VGKKQNSDENVGKGKFNLYTFVTVISGLLSYLLQVLIQISITCVDANLHQVVLTAGDFST
jgi:hypothetical protein